jgi:hypothetical protein
MGRKRKTRQGPVDLKILLELESTFGDDLADLT